MKFEIGDRVDIFPLEEDSFFEFTGRVVGYRNGFVQVKDLDNNVFECSEGQCVKFEE